MKFDLFVEQLLNEMPHVSFSSSGSVFNIDLKIENYKDNYKGFIDHVKDILEKIESENVKNDFIEELKKNVQFVLFLKKLFNKNFQMFLLDIKR